MTQKDQKTEEKDVKKKQGKLFIVSTPIGNYDDITLRALKVLKTCDVIFCEEAKVGARTLHKYNITQRMELLNEQNELEQTQRVIALVEEGKRIAVMSDAGTPVLADPGLDLVRSAIKRNLEMEVVPGVSSIMTALVRSGFSLSRFIFAGFLSREKPKRLAQLNRLKDEIGTIAILETPYRLVQLLEAAASTMPDRRAYVGCNLTMPYETHHYGTFSELLKKFKELRFKGEFTVVFEGSPIGSAAEKAFDSRRENKTRRRPQKNVTRRFKKY